MSDAAPKTNHAAEPVVHGVVSACIWSQDDAGHDIYSTSCNNTFRLDDGTPSENKMKFCCFCGGRLEEHLPSGLKMRGVLFNEKSNNYRKDTN